MACCVLVPCKQLLIFDYPNPLITPVPHRPHLSGCVEALSRLITPTTVEDSTTHHGGTPDTKCFTIYIVVFLQNMKYVQKAHHIARPRGRYFGVFCEFKYGFCFTFEVAARYTIGVLPGCIVTPLS